MLCDHIKGKKVITDEVNIENGHPRDKSILCNEHLLQALPENVYRRAAEPSVMTIWQRQSRCVIKWGKRDEHEAGESMAERGRKPETGEITSQKRWAPYGQTSRGETPIVVVL